MSCLRANINLSSSNLWATVEMPSQLQAAVGVANSLDAVVTLPSALDVRIGVMGVIIDAEASIICEPNIAEVKPDYSTYRGVYIQSVDGWLYSATEWDGSKEANGIAIQTDNVSIVLALKDAYSGYCIWGTRSNIAGVNNSDNKATVRKYFNGEAETDAIINNAANSTAATHCKNFIFPNGQNGYMGAGGEWWTVLTYKNDIITAMKVCGGTTPSKDYWCTTEQVGSNRAWAADWEGSDLTNYNKSASSSVRVRAFCKLIW